MIARVHSIWVQARAGVSTSLVALMIVILFAAAARAQSAADDPVSRAMERIEATVNPRLEAATAAIEASKLVNESIAAKKQKDRARAVENLERAEKIIAESSPRNPLIEELIRQIAAERYALNPELSGVPKSSTSGGSPLSRTLLARFGEYREMMAQILAEEGVPVELISVAMVESGFNPLALSPKGARGIWQFMSATARRYGLVVNEADDERTHPEHSTRAAARYLRALYNQFGDWKLALAAYNAGEARVQSIIDSTGIRDFNEMARLRLLPLETRNYVPRVMAAWLKLATGTTENSKARAEALMKRVEPDAR